MLRAGDGAAVKRGEHFLHARVLDVRSMADTEKRPQEYRITRVAAGWVYYRAYYGLHDDGSEWLGSPECMTVAEFPRIVRLEPHPLFYGMTEEMKP